MKRFLYLLFTILLTLTPVPASDKYADRLLTIEEELYGINYSDQSAETRIARLEQSIYGVVSKKSIDERVKKISDDLSADVISEKIKPCEDTFMAEEEAEELAADETVRYPALDRVETKLFSQTYDKNTLDDRLVRIEKQLFSRVYEDDSYNARVERIKNNVFKDDYRMASENAYYDDLSCGNGMRNGDLSGLNRNLYTGSGRTLFSDRLANLENEMLGGSYDSDTEEERINRLNSAYKAQQSIKRYDSNRFQQGLATAMQVGAMILMVLCMVL